MNAQAKHTPHLYAVCPHCEHPNVHVENGRLKPHVISLNSHVQCLGGGLAPQSTHSTPLNRHTAEFRAILSTEKQAIMSNRPEQDPVRPAFVTWKFSGIRFIAIPKAGGEQILDELGNHYGAWMSLDAFKARQQAGIIADWQSLGKGELQIVCHR